MATKSELRHYAKVNGITLAEAKEHFKNKAYEQQTIVVAPIMDDILYKGKTAGKYISDNNIQNAILATKLALINIDTQINVCLLVTNTVTEREAMKILEGWWQSPINAGPKYAVWLPTNDMSEVATMGLENIDETLRANIFTSLLVQAGLDAVFKDGLKIACQSNPDFKNSLNSLGNFGNMILSA